MRGRLSFDVLESREEYLKDLSVIFAGGILEGLSFAMWSEGKDVLPNKQDDDVKLVELLVEKWNEKDFWLSGKQTG